MNSDLQDIQQSLEKLEEINKQKQNLLEQLYSKIIKQQEEQKQLKSVITNLSNRLEIAANLKEKLESENRTLRRKIWSAYSNPTST